MFCKKEKWQQRAKLSGMWTCEKLYLDDEISWQAPGRKDWAIFREIVDGKKDQGNEVDLVYAYLCH